MPTSATSKTLGLIDDLINVIDSIPDEGPLQWPDENSSPAMKSNNQAKNKNSKAGKKEKAPKSSSQKKNVRNSAAGKAKAAATEQPVFSELDIRVGRIIRAWKHPDAESLYIEHIDLGEEQPRQVVSGLVKYVSQDQMKNATVLVIVNLKPVDMRGVMSYGMVLAATNADRSQVELVKWPVGSHLGERLGVEGMDLLQYPPKEIVDGKKKSHAFRKSVGFLRTNENGVACYDGKPLMTSAGYCTSTLRDAAIS